MRSGLKINIDTHMVRQSTVASTIVIFPIIVIIGIGVKCCFRVYSGAGLSLCALKTPSGDLCHSTSFKCFKNGCKQHNIDPMSDPELWP